MNSKLIKVACLATLVFVGATACKAPVEGGKAREAAKPVITKDGEHAITSKFHPKIQAPKPGFGCEWYVLWDIPGRPGKVVQMKHVVTSTATSVDLGKKYSFYYKDPKSGKRVEKRNTRGTTFVTKGCGNWYKK